MVITKRFVFLSCLFLASIFLISLVSAAEFADTVSGAFDPVRDMFASWAEGDLSVNIAKYVFWILLALVIYAITAYIPLIPAEQYWLRGIIAILVAFLATAYLTPSDIYLMLTSYGALGFVLGAGLPFIILLFTSIELRKQGGPGGILLSKALWLGFIAFLIYKVVQGIFVTKVIGTVEGFAYIGLIIVCILWALFAERAILRLIYKSEIKDEALKLDSSAMKISLAEAASAKRRATDLRAAGLTSEADELERVAKNIESKLGK